MRYIKTFEQFVNKDLLDINEKNSNNSYELSYPGTYIAKWSVSDSPCDEKTVAKRIDFSIRLEAGDSVIKNTTIEDSFVIAFSSDSTGVYSLGEDIEKYMGIPEKDVIRDVEAGKENEDDAIIMGMCNVMNAGKDIYFWNNGTRLRGSAKYAGPLVAILEQLSHEAGVHLNRKILVRHYAKENNIGVENGEWVSYNYGGGEYNWPGVGDLAENNPLIVFDEETFATMGGAVVSMVTSIFVEMASKYIPELSSIYNLIKQ